MTPAAFAARAVGTPWVRWKSSWEAMDCFGLVVLYYREVIGVDLGDVPRTDIVTGFADLSDRWRECDPLPGACGFMAFDDKGAAGHCGVLLDSLNLLHSEGGVGIAGSVRVTRLAVMRRIYADIRFYRYEAPACS